MGADDLDLFCVMGWFSAGIGIECNVVASRGHWLIWPAHGGKHKLSLPFGIAVIFLDLGPNSPDKPAVW